MTKGTRSKREMILEAAYDLFLNKGYWDTKIIDIAEKAGIGKGTVYEYFESKDDIFFELFQTKVVAGYDSLSELPGKKTDCKTKLIEYLDIELENSSKYTYNKSFLTDLMMKSDAFRKTDLIASIHDLMKKKFSILFRILKEGIENGEFRQTDPALAAVSVMGAINFYISINYTPFDPMEFLPEANKPSEWKSTEFLDLILLGLNRQD